MSLSVILGASNIDFKLKLGQEYGERSRSMHQCQSSKSPRSFFERKRQVSFEQYDLLHFDMTFFITNIVQLDSFQELLSLEFWLDCV